MKESKGHKRVCGPFSFANLSVGLGFNDRFSGLHAGNSAAFRSEFGGILTGEFNCVGDDAYWTAFDRKKTKKKVEEEREGEGSATKKSKSTSKRSAAKKVEATKKEETSEAIGSAAWVTKELESVGLGAFAKQFGDSLPLELLVFADAPHLDVLLRSTRAEPFPDIVDYIKLQCVIRSMHVKISGATGPQGQLIPSFPAPGSPIATHLARSSASGLDAASSDPNNKAIVQKLLAGDIVHWNEQDVQMWLTCTPALARFAPIFKEWNVDGRRLMTLNDRKLLQRFKLENDHDRALILAHVADLKALQLTHAAAHHSNILNKLIDGLASELGHAQNSSRERFTYHAPDPNDSENVKSATSHAGSTNRRVNTAAKQAVGGERTATQTSSDSSASPAGMLGAKRVPNYFLSLRIESMELRNKVKQIQAEIEELVPELVGSPSMLPPVQLHFTLGRLYLHTESDIQLAKQLLDECYDKVFKRLYKVDESGSSDEHPSSASSCAPTEVAVNFRGVQNYGGNTVFLETERGLERDLLIEFGNTVYEVFQEAGLTSKEFRFQPVAPILRVRQSKKPLMLRLQEVSSSMLLDKYGDAFLGRNVFSSLDISAVADQTDEDGYYKNLHSVSLQ